MSRCECTEHKQFEEINKRLDRGAKKIDRNFKVYVLGVFISILLGVSNIVINGGG